jgi:O-antigen/teichoic acid export membrane protein
MLVFLASVVSCFLAPWAEQLVDVLLGSEYHAAWPVLLLMLFYPIHQAVGQINGTLFMATGRNSVYMRITVAGLLVSIPVSYALIAPATGGGFPGLGLGAIGLALKIVGLNILFVSIQSWLIARKYGCAFQWRDQVVVILVLLVVGYGCRIAVEGLVPYVLPLMDGRPRIAVLAGMAVSGVIYLACTMGLFMRAPRLAGMDRSEVAGLLDKVTLAVRRAKEQNDGK